MAGKGGARPGAGRKPSTIKGVTNRLPKYTAEMILHEIKAHEKLIQLANSEDESIVLATIKFVWEHANGKPKQAVDMEHSGSILMQHSIPRPARD